jgi:Skp family chaperone for outer membrane proteins
MSTPSRSSGFFGGASLGAILSVGMVTLAGGLVAGRSLAPAPAIVASIDLSRVFNESNLNANNSMKLKAMESDFRTRVAEAQKKVEDKNGELDLYGPNSARWAQAQNELFTLIGELRAEQSFATGKLQTETSRSINDLYKTIRSEIATYAKSNGIDYVMVNDTIPPLVPAEPQKMMDQVAQRRFLYANDAYDITDAVIAAINQAHPLAPGATPVTAGGATPATAGGATPATAGGTAPAGNAAATGSSNTPAPSTPTGTP